MSLLSRLREADARRQNPVAESAPLPPAPPCAGCKGGVLELLKAGAKAASELLHYAVDENATSDVIEGRLLICQTCKLLDSNGKKMYRLDGNGQVRCGQPWEDLPIRDEKRDGCGCYLAIKTKGLNQHCPLGEW